MGIPHRHATRSHDDHDNFDGCSHPIMMTNASTKHWDKVDVVTARRNKFHLYQVKSCWLTHLLVDWTDWLSWDVGERSLLCIELQSSQSTHLLIVIISGLLQEEWERKEFPFESRWGQSTQLLIGITGWFSCERKEKEVSFVSTQEVVVYAFVDGLNWLIVRRGRRKESSLYCVTK